MKNTFQLLIVFSILLFSQCKQPKAVATVETKEVWHCQVTAIERPIFRTEVIVSNIYYEKDTSQIEILPLTYDFDTTNLRLSIQKHFKYSEMCKEMQYEGKVYFEISKDSTGNYCQTKVLRGIDGPEGTCTIFILKELNRILKIAPILNVQAEINSFILSLKIIIHRE